MSIFFRARTIGQSNRLIATTEAPLETAVHNIEILNQSINQSVNGIVDVLRQMDSEVLSLKREKECLRRQLIKQGIDTHCLLGSENGIVLHKTDTETETDGEVSNSNELFSIRKKTLKETFKQIKHEATQTEGSNLTKVVCKESLPQTEQDTYVSSSTDLQNLQVLPAEYGKVVNYNDNLTEGIRKFGAQNTKSLQDQKRKPESDTNKKAINKDKSYKKPKKEKETIYMLTRENKKKVKKIQEQDTRIQEINNQTKKSSRLINNTITETEEASMLGQGKILSDPEKRKDKMVKDLEKKLSQLDEQYNIRGQSLEQKNADIEKIKNELSLETVNFQNEKIKTTYLETKVTQLEEQILDLKLTNNTLETDLEITEATATQEKVKLQEKVTELSKKYASLLEKYESLKKEKEAIVLKPRKTKQLSFHSVLKQPQSDQAVGGIVSRLQTEINDAELETLQEYKRSNNVPLLVVLYNLSRLSDDAKGALNGVEASSDVALVVLHSKEIKKPSEKILTEPNFKKLGIIVDISFLSAKGIISNDTTDNAIKQLSLFIKKF